MTEQEKQPIPYVGGPADGRTTTVDSPLGISVPVQAETERFCWDEEFGLTCCKWAEASYKRDQDEAGNPVYRFEGMSRSDIGKLVLERPLWSSLRMMTDDTAIMATSDGTHFFSQEELAEMRAKGLP